MPNLTDYIEEHLKRLLALSNSRYIEIKRRELAGKFSCVPSQINYVLERRFSLEKGYLVESRRGGSGCIRIYRIESEGTKTWRELIDSIRDEDFNPSRVKHLLERLREEKLVSRREASILEAILADESFIAAGLSKSQARELQRRLLARALEELLKVTY